MYMAVYFIYLNIQFVCLISITALILHSSLRVNMQKKLIESVFEFKENEEVK